MQKDDMNTELLPQKIWTEIDKWVAKYPIEQKRSAILPALLLAQEHNQGWLSNAMIEAVAEYLEIPAIAAYEVATFYSMYELKPVGKYKICVCTNVSCMLSGSDEIVNHLQQKLGIGFGETTANGQYTLKEVECLGACANAPMFQIGKRYYEDLTPAKVDQILAELESSHD
jgi:NADH-quinone oxidoreductase subunit E